MKIAVLINGPRNPRRIAIQPAPCRRWLAPRLGWSLTALWFWINAASALAAPPAVELEIVPPAVGIPARGTARVLVVARNQSGEPLANLRFSAFTNTGARAAIDSPSEPALGPFGTLARTVLVSGSPEGTLQGKVHLRLDYTLPRQRGARRIAIASFDVSAQEPESIEGVADVQIRTALKSLVEHRPGILYLVVTNTAKVPIDIGAVRPYGPSFISITPSKGAPRTRLAPRDAQVYRFEVAATGKQIQPGTHLLLFQVPLAWERMGRALAASAIVTHEMDVSILGESEILTALGVPTFLFLPGFLIIVTVQLLRRFYPGKAQAKPAAELTKAQFWLVAITLSMVAALAYRIVTGWLGDPRNYLEGYRLEDVVRVWGGSILVTFFLFVAWVSVTELRQRRRLRKEQERLRQEQERTPVAGDSPVEILRKLDRQGLGFILETAELPIAGRPKGERLYLLQRPEGRTRIWVGSGLDVRWPAAAGADLRKRIDSELKRQDQGSAARLADLLQEAAEKEVKVDWRLTGEAHKGPRETDLSPLVLRGRDLFVEIEDE